METNGLPVCTKCERVNRYTVIFRDKLTARTFYGNMTLEENVYSQGYGSAAPAGRRQDRAAAASVGRELQQRFHARLGEGK